MIMMIHAEKLYSDLLLIYRENRWHSREVHFSLEDMKMNILAQPHQDQFINKQALLERLDALEPLNNLPVPEWVRKVIKGG